MMLPSNGSLEVIESSANSGQLKKQNLVVQLAKFMVSLMKVVGARLRSGAIVMATDGHNGILSHQEGTFSLILTTGRGVSCHINSVRLYQGKHGKKRNNLRERECKPTTEKQELKFDTINNLPNPPSIHGGKHYPNLEWQTWHK
ncbi:hypothetical protein YC2023_011260 [Brassica napus]